jgi:hypothetical protein
MLLLVEALQIYALRSVYFSDKWNWLYITSYLTNIIIIFIHTSRIDYDPIQLA